MRNVGCADGSIHDEPCGTITTSFWVGASSGAVARINTLPGLPARNVAVALDCAPRGTLTRLGEKVPLPACPVPDGSCAKSMVRFRSFATGWNWLSRKSTVSRAVSPTRSVAGDRKSTRLNSSHSQISYAVFCLKKKKKINIETLESV